MLVPSLGLFTSLVVALVAVAQALDRVVAVDFYSGVLYDPPDAWRSEFSSACGTVDFFTTTVNASATLNFEGDRVQVLGMSNNVSGVMRVQVDDLPPSEVSLWSRNVSCTLFVDQYLSNGSHTMKLSLIGPAASGSEGLSYTPVMHLMSIWYAIPQPGDASASSVPGSSEGALGSSSSRGVAGIVAGTVCGVVGLLAILFAIFFLVRRRRTPIRKNRHTFNPNTVIITELTPRSPTDDKLPPYARMDDDLVHDPDVKSQHLAVPLPSLGYKNSAGLRSRSPSPAPPERRV